jgi:hypothetical protein
MVLFALPAWAASIGRLPVPQASLGPPEEVVEGLRYRRLEGQNSAGQPLVGHLLEIDPKAGGIEVRPALGGDRLGLTEKVSSLARRYGAVAAVNGGFFYRSAGLALPVGNLAVDGHLVSVSDFLRPTIGFTRKGEFRYGFLSPQPALKLAPDGPALPVHSLNRPYQASRINLYTPAWGPTTGAPPGTPELVLLPAGRSWRVAAVGGGNSSIPPRGMVLCLAPGAAPEVPLGREITFSPGLPPQWQEVRHFLTGGPLLVEDGQPVFEAVQEGFTGTILGRKARTAVGTLSGGKLGLVVIEGGEEQEAGVTLEEMAFLLSSLGFKVAVGLDGGGSSAMWVAGRLVSKPPSGYERPVANALLVLRSLPVYLDDWRLPCDAPPLIVGGRVLVPLRSIFQGLGASVEWDANTRAVIARKGDREIRLVVGQKLALVNGKPLLLDVPASVVDGRTLVPVRFVAHALGATVEWRAAEPALYIYR